MKNFIFVLLVLFCVQSSSAQLKIENINLNDYKLTDYNYKRLNFYFNFNGNGNVASNHTPTNDDDFASFSTGVESNLYFTSFKNNRKKQQFRRYSIGFDPRFSFSKQNDLKEITNVSINNHFSGVNENKY